jgi:AraC-like DNA-binding protein
MDATTLVQEDRLERRIRADQQELAERIARAQPIDGRIEAQPGLYLNRFSTPGELGYSVLEPSFCVIAQGSKYILVGDERFRYDPAHYLLTTMGLPVVGQVIDATPARPYLGFRLVLDPAVVMSVMLESNSVDTRGESGVRGIAVNPLDGALLDATLRLVRLLEEPTEYRALAPLVGREIIYRLLKGAQGDRLRHLTTFGGRAHRMARAVETLRRSFDQPLRIEDLAGELNMSVSGFHAHFKAATAMTPLQFQKELRLQAARRLMLSEKKSAAEAGFEVGYDDASHFSRDYRRHFGEPPLRDIQRLRESAAAAS